MEIVIVASPKQGGEMVADAIARLVSSRSNPVLGLATGSSPLPAYRSLIDRCRAGELSFANVRAFLLDEYLGLPHSHPQCYRSFIRAELTDQVDLPADSLFGPDSLSSDPAIEAAAYDRMIAASGGIDIQLLGIGGDGHIGFNEPSSSLASRTRIKTLMDSTRQDNARFFDGDVEAVPNHVITQGVGTILDARHLVLIANGEGKADAVRSAVEGPITAMVPASALQLHPHATIFVDEAAAAQLQNADYYREAFSKKPDWQQV